MQWAWPFADPVDTARYPDYLKVVKNPMDLKWVKRKVDAGQYATPADFAADFRQVFANAHTYNPPGSDVYVMASTLLVCTCNCNFLPDLKALLTGPYQTLQLFDGSKK